MKGRTAKQNEAIKKLSEENNKLRWFCIPQPFKCKLITLSIGWYELTGSFKLDDNWVHDIKLRDSNKNLRISDVDYEKIIINFKKENQHLKS